MCAYIYYLNQITCAFARLVYLISTDQVKMSCFIIRFCELALRKPPPLNFFESHLACLYSNCAVIQTTSQKKKKRGQWIVKIAPSSSFGANYAQASSTRVLKKRRETAAISTISTPTTTATTTTTVNSLLASGGCVFTCVCRSRSRLENDDLAMMNDVIGVGWHYYAPFLIGTSCVNIHNTGEM